MVHARQEDAAHPYSTAPLIIHHADRCLECWGCVRQCPARAIKIVDGHFEVNEARCVKCGICVTECGNGGHVVRDDLPSVRALLESDRPVVALLATEFVAALHPMSSHEVEARLLALGFDAIETTVLGEELVASAYITTHSPTASLLPRLRSTCPVVVDWVSRFHPHLVGALVPLVPPYVAQARLVRALYPKNAAIVYVSPCWARKDEIFDEQLEGTIDIGIGFDEIRRLIEESPEPSQEVRVPIRPRAVKQLSVTDGFPRRVLTERDLTSSDVAIVRGLKELDELLDAISRGETAPAVVDMLNCEGCLDGPCVNSELSVYVKRNVDMSERERQPPAPADSKSLFAALPSVNLQRTFLSRPALVGSPSDEEIDAVLAAGEFGSRAETIDCGACGFTSCVQHAAAIWDGHSSWDVCFPLQRKRLLREREQFAEVAMLDTLTGLMNRRAFDARVAEEIARSERYSLSLALIMLDLDAFKEINDAYGHQCGDDLLRAVGVVLHSQLRGADVAYRYGGDEFAVLLPNTGKTDAWAVGEKVRTSIARIKVACEDKPWIATTVSVGVAAVCDGTLNPRDLVEAADRALYAAKRSGRDRVELAPG